MDRPQGGGYNSCEGRQDRHHANGSGQTIREFLHRRERIGLESDVQAALVPQRWDYKVPRNCDAEDWHSSKDAGSIRQRYETAAPQNCHVSVDLHPVWRAEHRGSGTFRGFF